MGSMQRIVSRRRVIFLSLIFVAFSCAQNQERYEINLLWTCQADNLEPIGDINGDGYEEFFKERKGDYTLLSFNNAPVWQRLRPESCFFRGKKDNILFFNLIKGSTAHLGLLENFTSLNGWGSNLPVRDLGEIISGRDTSKTSVGWDGRFGLKNYFQTGSKEISLFFLNIGLDAGQKGLLALDGKVYQELWRYRMGPTVEDVCVDDLNGDQKNEIVVGTYAINNNHQDNGTTDTLAYVFVFNQNGELLWKKVIGRGWETALVRVGDLDRDGNNEVVVVEESGGFTKEEPDSVMIFDGDGKIEHNILVGKKFWGVTLGDLNRDGRDEIITGNSDGVIRAFNSTLEVVAASDINSEAVKVHQAGDLNGDGSVEVVASSVDGNHFFIMNRKLSKVADYKFSYGGDSDLVLSVVKSGNGKGILASHPNSGNYSLFGFRSRGLLGTGLTFWWFLFFGGIILVSAAGGIYFFVRRTIINRTEAVLHSVSAKKKTGVLYLDRKRKVKFVNDALCNLLGVERESVLNQPFDTALAKVGLGLYPAPSFEKTVIKTPTGEKNIAVYTTSLGRNRLLIQLEDASREDYARKMEAWAPVAQKLAHGIKNPLSHIRLAVQQLTKLIPDNQTPKAGQYSSIVLGEINRLIKIVDGFMKFTDLKPPHPKLTNLHGIIEGLIEKLKPVLPKGAMLEFLPATETLPIHLDEQQIRDSVMNLLDNALSAVGNKGAVTIRTTLLERVDKPPEILPYVEIQISDTGPGIPEEYKAKLFQPYFSTKPEGTGLGLCITKKIIEDHGGTIKIDSKPGLGTAVTIQLPVA